MVVVWARMGPLFTFLGSRCRAERGAPRQLMGCFSHPGGIEFQRHQPFNPLQGISKDEPCALQSAEEISQQREGASLDIGEEQRRPAGLVYPPLNRPRLEIGIHLGGRCV